MIVIFLGEQNSGKTLSMSYYLYRYFKNGYKIYSNYNLNFKHEKINKSMLETYTKSKEQFSKTVFALDEIYLFMDSRNFGKGFNKLFSYFILQTSKRDTHLIGTAQYFNTVEKRFRENCNIMVNCSRVIYNIEKNIYENVNSNLRIIDSSDLHIRNLFLFKKSTGIFEHEFKHKIVYLKAQEVFKLYNTRELLGVD